MSAPTSASTALDPATVAAVESVFEFPEEQRPDTSDSPLTSREAEMAETARLTTRHGRVGSVRQLTPQLLEVTVTGFDGYPLSGGDEFVYVLVSPEPEGIAPGYDMARYMERDPADPVRGAYYTVRRSRPETGEIDLWVVVHGDHADGDPGRADIATVSRWMTRAAPGSPMALWGPRAGYRPPDDVRHLLLVADETGLAAVAALIEQLPTGRRATAVVEAAGPQVRPAMPRHPGLQVVWVDRGVDAPGTVNHLLAAVERTIDDGDLPDAAFGAAESRQITAVRRLVRRRWRVPASRVSTTGYWRRGAD
jgi:NADPH-dependent ferric siderophore reductase